MSSGLDLRLLVLVGHGADTLALADAGPDIVPADAGAVISLTQGGREHLGAVLTWGPYHRVALQFEPAAARLESGRMAMIRSARLDISAGICLIAEPHRSSVVVSLGAVADLRFASWFPDDPEHGDELLDHVREHRDAVVAAASRLAMEPVRGARGRLTTALRREAGFASREAARSRPRG